MITTCDIDLRLPSLNDYIRICRGNRHEAANIKRELEAAISVFLRPLPRFERPVRICFVWIESDKRRDLDNIAFAKKFILDALVKMGKLADDDRRHVKGFEDRFEYGKRAKVVLYITDDDRPGGDTDRTIS